VTSARTSGPPAAALIGAWLVATAGCAAPSTTASGCQKDTQCPTNQACMASTCIAREAPTGTFSVELVPTSDANAAITQINGVTFDGSSAAWTARPEVTITGGLGLDATLVGSSHVIATLPSAIPGLADLQFESEWPAGTKNTPTQFMLSVPDSVLGASAQVDVLPTPPDDRKQAPISLQTKLATTLWLTFPADALTVHGRLVSAIKNGRDGFLARALQGATVISNVAETQSGGVFSLTIPTGNISSDPTAAITVELSPSDDQSADPRFTSHAVTLTSNTDLGDVHLPAYGQPNVFRFEVHGDSSTGDSIGNAVVHAHASIDGSTDGSADYTRSGPTNMQGVADLSLLPGTADTLRPYDITVVPPADSKFGVVCLPAFPLAAGGTAAAPALASKVVLPRRAVVSGTIIDANQAPVVGMTIVATRTDVSASGACSTAVAVPSSITSRQSGQYQLLLDPGTYTIDYDPPAGAAVPRLTESAVPVAGDAERNVTLPAATLVEGVVQGVAGDTLASVLIHLYRVRCSAIDQQPCSGPNRLPPLLRAIAHTDNTGAFRMVVPQGSGY
jgi:hypothetical protein